MVTGGMAQARPAAEGWRDEFSECCLEVNSALMLPVVGPTRWPPRRPGTAAGD